MKKTDMKEMERLSNQAIANGTVFVRAIKKNDLRIANEAVRWIQVYMELLNREQEKVNTGGR
jgi:hypothetical protein